MRVLLLGNDEKTLQSGSPDQKRMIGYGSLAEQIHLLIFSVKRMSPQQAGNVFIYSSGGCCRLSCFFRGYLSAKKIIIRNKIDVISTQDPFETAWLGWRLKRRTGARLNIQIHGDFFGNDYWENQRWFNFIRYKRAISVLKKADSIRVVSTRVRKSLIEKFKIASAKIIVAPIYSDFSEFNGFVNAGGGQKGSGAFVFLTASRLTKEKNLAMAMRAFSKLRRGGREAVLKIVGDGPERKNLEGLAQELKIESKVEFLGWLSKEALASEYAKADCFLAASDFEGWGLASLEAAYFGLPIVMTDVGVCGEIFQPQRDVLCSPPRDEEKFLANMQNVLDNEKLRQELSQNGKAALAKLPSQEQTMELYKRAWEPKKLDILVFTQKVDINDDVLAAFCYWWEKLAQKASQVNIICLFEGKHSLPENVKVFSLGKEKEHSRIKYVWRVYKYLWPLRKTTDVIFVHMNEVYVFLLWPLAKIYHIPIVFWKAHGGRLPHIKKVIFMSDKIVTSGVKTFEYDTPKKVIIGQGVNVDFFSPASLPASGAGDNRFQVLAVGRLGPVKHYDILIEAADILLNQRQRSDFSFKIVGSPQHIKEEEHQKQLKKMIEDKKLERFFTFEPGVPFGQIKQKYQECSCLVNLTDPPSLEKVVLEAMAMEKPIITSNEAFWPFFDGLEVLKVQRNNPADLADKIEHLAGLSALDRLAIGQKLRAIVVADHSVDHLISRLMDIFYSVAK